MKLEFLVVVPDELSAGIRGFTDEITVVDAVAGKRLTHARLIA